jgi:rhamnogalacturonyl hydrolase YesR
VIGYTKLTGIAPTACQNNGGTTWTYNQGVILSGLAAMFEIIADRGYLNQAESIAHGPATRTRTIDSGCAGPGRLIALTRLGRARPATRSTLPSP